MVCLSCIYAHLVNKFFFNTPRVIFMLTKYFSIHFPFKKLIESDDVAFLNTSGQIKMHNVSFRPTFAMSYVQSTQMPCHFIPNLVLIIFLNDILYCYLRNYYSCRPNSIFMNFLVFHSFFSPFCFC